MLPFSVNRATSWTIIVIIVMIPVIFAYHFIAYNLLEDEKDDTITVEFHCPTVLSMKDHYPGFVVTECERMLER